MQNKALMLMLLILSLGSQAYAQLGQRVSTSDLSLARARAAGKLMLYEVRASVVDGVAIKEYFSNDGVIFAVSWRGVAKPDLTNWLGSYFSEYDKAARDQLPAQRLGRSAVISSEQIIVRQFGHMRDVRGVAYVPALLPAGVDPQVLQ